MLQAYEYVECSSGLHGEMLLTLVCEGFQKRTQSGYFINNNTVHMYLPDHR